VKAVSGGQDARALRDMLVAVVAIDDAGDVTSVRSTVLPRLLQAVSADSAVWHQISPPPVMLIRYPETTRQSVSATDAAGDGPRRLAIDIDDDDCLVRLSLRRDHRDFTDREAVILESLQPFLQRRVRRLVSNAGGLSCRERQVLDLVGQGLTGHAVAHRLGCRPRTVDKHLEHIYRKLGVSGRVSALRALRALGEFPAIRHISDQAE
jgi:DNA-binding CsgD family transcriptional regulator